MTLATKGLAQSCHESQAILEGVNTYQGHIVYPAVAESQGKEAHDLKSLL
jgi:alanine dehydrogenase